MKQLLTVISIALFATGAQAAGDVSSILACMRSNVPPTPMVAEVSVTTSDPATDVSRTVAGRFFLARGPAEGEGGSQLWAMLRIQKPEYLEGAAYLVREVDNRLRNEMFVYLPAVGRVRRITGSFANKPLFGTTFSYFDFKQIWNAFGDLMLVAIEGTTKINGRPVYKLHFHTPPDSRIAYSTIAVWVDKKTCVPLRVDFIRDGEVIKRMTVPKGALEKTANGYWYPSRIEMTDLVDNLTSVMRIQSLKKLEKPRQSLFDPESFYKHH